MANPHNKGITKQTTWVVPCIECGKERRYKYLQHYYRARDIYKRCKSCASKRQVQSEETKQKRRERRKGLGPVWYNPVACSLFEEINSNLGWNGRHAENGGEQEVRGFFLDYYEPILNIVVEYDEKHHQKPNRRRKDGFRQKMIKEALGCKFYRIQEGKNWREILKEYL